MDMFVFRVDLAAFFPQMNKASVLNHVFAAFHGAKATVLPRWGEFHPHSRRVRGDQAQGAEAAGSGGERP